MAKTCIGLTKGPSVVLCLCLMTFVCIYMEYIRVTWHRPKPESATKVSRRVQPESAKLPKATFLKVLSLHMDTSPKCPRILFLRTPKSASSSISEILFAKKKTIGRSCEASLFQLSRYTKNKYTIDTHTIAHVPQQVLDNYSMFIGHMNYTTALRRRLHADKLYRVTTVRSALGRMESFMRYEADRPYIEMESAVQYLWSERKDLYLHRHNISNVSLSHIVNSIVRYWHLIIVTEFLDQSLAVLMHDLNWRAVDMVAPRINVRPRDQSRDRLLDAQRERLETEEEREIFRRKLRVDAMLYKRAVAVLRDKFSKLPDIYRHVPAVLQIVRRDMVQTCAVYAMKKHYYRREMSCIRKFREDTVRKVRRMAG